MMFRIQDSRQIGNAQCIMPWVSNQFIFTNKYINGCLSEICNSCLVYFVVKDQCTPFTEAMLRQIYSFHFRVELRQNLVNVFNLTQV